MSGMDIKVNDNSHLMWHVGGVDAAGNLYAAAASSATAAMGASAGTGTAATAAKVAHQRFIPADHFSFWDSISVPEKCQRLSRLILQDVRKHLDNDETFNTFVKVIDTTSDYPDELANRTFILIGEFHGVSLCQKIYESILKYAQTGLCAHFIEGAVRDEKLEKMYWATHKGPLHIYGLEKHHFFLLNHLLKIEQLNILANSVREARSKEQYTQAINKCNWQMRKILVNICFWSQFYEKFDDFRAFALKYFKKHVDKSPKVAAKLTKILVKYWDDTIKQFSPLKSITESIKPPAEFASGEAVTVLMEATREYAQKYYETPKVLEDIEMEKMLDYQDNYVRSGRKIIWLEHIKAVAPKIPRGKPIFITMGCYHLDDIRKGILAWKEATPPMSLPPAAPKKALPLDKRHVISLSSQGEIASIAALGLPYEHMAKQKGIHLLSLTG